MGTALGTAFPGARLPQTGPLSVCHERRARCPGTTRGVLVLVCALVRKGDSSQLLLSTNTGEHTPAMPGGGGSGPAAAWRWGMHPRPFSSQLEEFAQSLVVREAKRSGVRLSSPGLQVSCV